MSSAAIEECEASQKPLPGCLCPWLENPDRPVSLWEILIGGNFASQIHSLLDGLRMVEDLFPDDPRPLDESAIKSVTALMELKPLFFRQFGMESSAQRIELLVSNIRKFRSNHVLHELKMLRDGLERDLNDVVFFYIPKAKLRLTQDRFGDQVSMAFPDAIDEIAAANHCLVCDACTAAVFHLMRSAELGIRELIADRQIVFKNNSPVELQEWSELLRHLDAALQTINNWPKSTERAQAQEFYGSAVSEFRGMKDTWRNPVMHTRRIFVEAEAMRVREHVKRFLSILAARIAQGKYTPIVWDASMII